MTKLRFTLGLSCLLVLVLSASPAFANGVKADIGASGKGVLNADCAGTIQENPACFEFSPISSTVATWEAFSLTDFATSTFSTIGPYDLFLVNGVVSGTQVTFTLTGTNDAFGSFFCGDDPSMASSANLGAFCSDPANTLFGDASGIFSQLPDITDAANQATFIFNGNAPSAWVFYASPDATMTVSNGTTSTPEPSTLLFLVAGAGLLVFAKLRRT
jgi:hypothetical protein